MRVGIGCDVHRLVKGRPLILGGVEIPFEMGLEGHSDADVLTHAIMDSFLGAAALGDIGVHFPDTDGEYKNISSIKLLKKVCSLIKDKGYRISNVDCVVVAQAPKLASFIPRIRNSLANVLSIGVSDVSIKATTTEGLGFEGKGEGISAQAVCVLERMVKDVSRQ